MAPETPNQEVKNINLEAPKTPEAATAITKFEIPGLKQAHESVDAALKTNPDALVKAFQELITALQNADKENQEIANKLLSGLAEITGMQFKGSESPNMQMMEAAAVESMKPEKISAIMDWLDVNLTTENAIKTGQKASPKQVA